MAERLNKSYLYFKVSLFVPEPFLAAFFVIRPRTFDSVLIKLVLPFESSFRTWNSNLIVIPPSGLIPQRKPIHLYSMNPSPSS